MKNVKQFVKRKTQVLDVFKRKKQAPGPLQHPPNPVLARPLQFQHYQQFQPEPEPELTKPRTITISGPVVTANANSVTLNNPIINNFQHQLIQPTIPGTAGTKPIFVNRNISNPRKDVRNSLSRDEAQHLEQNLKKKISDINTMIQKQYRENQPPSRVPPPKPNKSPSVSPTPQLPEPSPTPGLSSSPKKVTFIQEKEPPEKKDLPRTSPILHVPIVSPSPRRFGVKLTPDGDNNPLNFSGIPHDSSFAPIPAASTPSVASSAFASKHKPDAKPLPARPPVSLSTSPPFDIQTSKSPPPNDFAFPSANHPGGLWKCLPDGLPNAPLLNKDRAATRMDKGPPPDRPLPPTPTRSLTSPTRDVFGLIAFHSFY